MTTGFSFFKDVADLPFIFRKRALHPGSGIGPHEQKEDEIDDVLSGKGELTLDGRWIEMGLVDAIRTCPGSTTVCVRSARRPGDHDCVSQRRRIAMRTDMATVNGTAGREQRAGTVAAIEAAGVVAVIRLKEPASLRAVVDALAEGGVRALEVTMTVPGAVELIRALAPTLPTGLPARRRHGHRRRDRVRVIDAGAQFIVSPVFRMQVLAAAHARTSAAMPGCFTPTEILEAWEAGADIVKVFPATALGPGFFKDMHGPLPQVKLMPTGGVTLDNVGDWIRAGAVAVGVGTALLDAKAIAAGESRCCERTRSGWSRNVRRGPGEGVMTKVVTFGEIMLRLSPPGFERFFQSPVLSRDVRRGRGQRGGQSRAVRPRE